MSAGRVYWITGLSGVGKSSLAEALHEKLKAMGHTVILLDGDAIRDLLLEEAGFDRDSRLKVARFNARLCHFLSGQGVEVVCATMSLFHEVQNWNRKHIAHYTEILLDAPLEMLKKRDSKGVYSRSNTNVVGIDIAPQWPKHPDFSFISDGSTAIPKMVEHIVSGNKK